MKNRTHDAMLDPAIRRVFEEEVLVDEATDTVAALLESLGLAQRTLAERLGVSEGRVSQILSGGENLTLRSLGALGWALGVRFDVVPKPMAERRGTPAVDDPPPPAWLTRLRPQVAWNYGRLELPSAERVRSERLSSRVDKSGELEAVKAA